MCSAHWDDAVSSLTEEPLSSWPSTAVDYVRFSGTVVTVQCEGDAGSPVTYTDRTDDRLQARRRASRHGFYLLVLWTYTLLTAIFEVNCC